MLSSLHNPVGMHNTAPVRMSVLISDGLSLVSTRRLSKRQRINANHWTVFDDLSSVMNVFASPRSYIPRPRRMWIRSAYWYWRYFGVAFSLSFLGSSGWPGHTYAVLERRLDRGMNLILLDPCMVARIANWRNILNRLIVSKSLLNQTISLKKSQNIHPLHRRKLIPGRYALFENYQRNVHHEAPWQITPAGFRRFLCTSPLKQATLPREDGQLQSLGSFHQCYRLDGRLIAVGVLDLLPQGVSAVYFMYVFQDPEMTVGTVRANPDSRDKVPWRCTSMAFREDWGIDWNTPCKRGVISILLYGSVWLKDEFPLYKESTNRLSLDRLLYPLMYQDAL